jgi:hypothetical protein
VVAPSLRRLRDSFGAVTVRSAVRVLALVAGVTSIVRASLASATPEAAVHLVWIRGAKAEACADQEAVLRELRERLGRDPFDEGAARTIRVEVAQGEKGWIAHVIEQEGDRPGTTRELVDGDPSCTPIKDAAVLVVALLIDPAAALLRTPSPGPPVSTSAPPAPEPRRRDRKIRAAALAHAIGSVGILPGFAPGLSLAVEGGADRFGASAGFLRLWPRHISYATKGTFVLELTAASLGFCVHIVRFGPGAFGSCAKGMGGVVHSAPVSLAPRVGSKDPGERAWFGVALSPQLRIQLLRPLMLEAGVDLIAQVRRDAFTYLQSQPTGGQVQFSVFAQAPVAAAPFLGIGVSIP